MKRRAWGILILVCGFVLGCESSTPPSGAQKNPLRFYVVPSTDSGALAENAQILKDYLQKNTPYYFEMVIPPSYQSVIEGFQFKKTDISFINTASYYIVHDKYKTQARLTVLRGGHSTYQSQFIVRADSKIKSLKNLGGKTVAFVDPASMSGYILPTKTLKDLNIKLGKEVIASKHDEVVRLVYDKKVDAGVTYEDAHKVLASKYPDILDKIKVLELSEPIPNDPIVFREDLPEEMIEKIVNTLLLFATTAEGKKTLEAMIGATNFKKSTDADYESVRVRLKR